MKTIIIGLFVMIASFAVFEPVLAAAGDFMVDPPPSTFDVTTSFTSPTGSDSYIDTSRSNVVVITDNVENQFGAIWSNGRMDMTKPFVYDSHLYWGRSQAAPLGRYGGVDGGDGMTFTLHNDPAGVQAYGGLGGALGVYTRAGVPAVRNALSFELDTFANADYDQQIPFTPSDPDRDRHTAFVTPTSALNALAHSDLKKFDDYDNLVDEWVKFTAVWTPVGAGGTLTVTLDDVTSTYHVANTIAQFGGNFAHLGFSGATGGLSALQAVAVTALPEFSYNLSFNLGYTPSTPPATQTILADAVVTLPTPDPRTGFTFDGWFDTGGTRWVSGSTRMPSRNVQLTARWSAASVPLSFDLNGKPGTPPPTQQVTFGTTNATAPVPAPTAPGFNFVGWSTSATVNTPWNFDTTTMPATPVTLYAMWDVSDSTVSFDLNGAPGTPPPSQTVQIGTPIAEPAQPTRVGHSFTGWNTAANGSGTTWNFNTMNMPASGFVLYAQWSANAYNLTFDLNGGTGTAPSSQSVTFGQLATMPPVPTRPGYTFTGWNTTTGSNWDFATTTMPANDVALTAQWTINSYNLSFDLNGGTSAVPDVQNIVFGELGVAPATPFREGSTFTGWNTMQNGSGTLWDFATNTMPGNDVVLYAQWSLDSFSMSFDLNGGTSATPNAQTIPFGQLATAPATPVREGYTFVGWNTSANGAGTNWQFTTTTMPASDVTLYAQWTINSYDLTFDINGGIAPAPITQSVPYGQLASEPTPPTRTGFTFTGWNTMQNGQGIAWDFANNTMPANSVTLYAQWTINSYELSFDTNGGTSATPDMQTVVFNQLATAPATPVMEGHTFTGWNTSSDGTGMTWDFNTTSMPANNVVLYAQWTINSYTMNFDVNGGESTTPDAQSIVFGQFATAPADPTRTGFTFIGWNTVQNGSGINWEFSNMGMPANNVSLYAQWSINSYNMTFDLNGGTSDTPDVQSVVFNQLATMPEVPYKEGHTFIGWNTLADGSELMWDFATMPMPAMDVYLYAQWSINTYTLDFDLNGGTSLTPDAQAIVFNELAFVPEDPTVDGYTFMGWNTADDGTDITWDFDTMTMPAHDVTLYAMWSINSYNMNFDLNGGTSDIPDSQTIEYKQLATIPSIPVREGFTFVGWNTDVDGIGTNWDFDTMTMPSYDVTLYAQWAINTYYLDFDLNGAPGDVPETQSIVFNELAVPVTDPSYIGYTFAGWNTLQDGSGTIWDFETMTMPAQDVLLYAQWTVNSYNLNFDINGGDGQNPDSQVLDFNTAATEPTTPERHEYKFLGWNTNIDGSGDTWSFIDPSTMMPAHDVTLYAQWSSNAYYLEFDLNGAPGIAPSTQTIVYNELAEEPVDPTYAGYKFKGWNTSKDGSGTYWDFSTTQMPGNDVRLYAQWSKVLLPDTGYDNTFIHATLIYTLLGSTLLITRKRKLLK